MIKQRVVIYDADREYGSRLAEQLNRKCGDLFATQCSDESSLQAVCDSQHTDLLLIRGTLSAELIRECRAEHLRFLTDNPSQAQAQKERFLYRFQPADQLIRELRAVCRDAIPQEILTAGQNRIFGIFSPVSNCFKTTIALLLSRTAARKGLPLYISLEEMPALDAVLGTEPAEGSLSDAVFFHSQGRLREELAGLVYNWNGADLLGPVRFPEDLREAGPEELCSLISEIRGYGCYASVFLDFSGSICLSEDILPICSTIFMPSRPDPVSERKTQLFLERLRRRQKTDILERIIPVMPPIIDSLQREGLFLEQLYWGPFGEFVRELYDKHCCRP